MIFAITLLQSSLCPVQRSDQKNSILSGRFVAFADSAKHRRTLEIFMTLYLNRSDEGGAKPTKILVADDNQPSAMTLSWAMEAFGHEVRTCYNGREAVEEAMTFYPDVVLLDIGMPVMDGLDACRAMRAQPGMGGTLIIAQTAWSDTEAREKSAAAGFNFHMVKPIDLDEVERLVSTRAKK